jgi:hypothetical protein
LLAGQDFGVVHVQGGGAAVERSAVDPDLQRFFRCCKNAACAVISNALF